MQESLYDTVQKLKATTKMNIEQVEVALDSNLDEIVSLCKKACLKPKTDASGSAYFTSDDVDVLKKMKELYNQSKFLQEENRETKEIKETKDEEDMTSPNKKINFLTKAKSRIKSISTLNNDSSFAIQGSFQKLENNLVQKISDLLSEKMDGFDEIIVELIRSKTENENLRTQVNDLNKQLYILKKELASYAPLPFGLYTKKECDDEL